MTSTTRNHAARGIAFILVGMIGISVNDMMIKHLSGGYPLHQMVFTRSAIGIFFSLLLVQAEGGLGILRTRRPGLHILRGLLLVAANMTFFLAIAVLPLADATALFFAAPLFITLLSIPILGEKVGPLRLSAVLVGFCGVLMMQRPWASAETLGASRLVLLLPVVAALTYAFMQVLTRKLGSESKASAMTVYLQVIFVIVSLGFWAVAGDGRFAEGSDDPGVQFLLRAWIWPAPQDRLYFLGLGLNSAIVGYCLAAAYRDANAATIAPFEYIGLPLAVFWGWVVWSDLPDLEVWIGMVLIAGSGVFVFLREQQKAHRSAKGPVAPR